MSAMTHVYEFEVFHDEEFLLALPFDFEGGTQGIDHRDLAKNAADWLKTMIEFSAMRGEPLPEPTFGNEPRRKGSIMLVAVDAGLHTIPRMTAAEAARALGVTPARVSHMIRDGQLDSFRYGHNTWVSRHHVEALMKSRRPPGRPHRAKDPAEKRPAPANRKEPALKA